MKIKYPKNEIVWTEYVVNGVPRFIMTSKESRDYYFLYNVGEDGSVEKLGKARTPTELEEKYKVNEIMLVAAK